MSEPMVWLLPFHYKQVDRDSVVFTMSNPDLNVKLPAMGF